MDHPNHINILGCKTGVSNYEYNILPFVCFYFGKDQNYFNLDFWDYFIVEAFHWFGLAEVVKSISTLSG